MAVLKSTIILDTYNMTEAMVLIYKSIRSNLSIIGCSIQKQNYLQGNSLYHFYVQLIDNLITYLEVWLQYPSTLYTITITLQFRLHIYR